MSRTPVAEQQVQAHAKTPNAEDPLGLLNTLTIGSQQPMQPRQQPTSSSSPDPFFALFSQGNQSQSTNTVQNNQPVTTNNNASSSNNNVASVDSDDPFFAIAMGR